MAVPPETGIKLGAEVVGAGLVGLFLVSTGRAGRRDDTIQGLKVDFFALDLGLHIASLLNGHVIKLPGTRTNDRFNLY